MIGWPKCDCCGDDVRGDESWYWGRERVCQECFEVLAGESWWAEAAAEDRRRRLAVSLAMSVVFGVVLMSALGVVWAMVQA